LHVEPVVWIASRKDVLSTLFWMLALVAYERYRRTPSLRGYLAVTLAYVLGLLSKPMVITLPVILLVLDYWPLGRCLQPTSASAGAPAPARVFWRRAGMLGAEKLPLLAMAGVSAWVTTTSASDFGVMQAQNLPLVARVQNSIVSYVLYLRELVVPVDLSIHHERFTAAPSPGQLWGALAIATTLSFIALRSWRAHPYLLAGWLFYLVSFLPVIGLLQYGGHSIADRYAYVPSIGAFVAAVWGIHALFSRLPNGAFLQRTVTAAGTLVFGLLSLLQVGYWRSGEELFQHAVDLSPGNGRLHNLLGIELARRGALREAEQHFIRAIEASPAHTRAMNNLGVLLLRTGRAAEAKKVYERMLRIDPRDASGHTNLGHALASTGHSAEAEHHYRTAIQYDPGLVAARTSLAQLLASTGRGPEARRELEKAIELYPNRTELRDALANLSKHSPAGSHQPGEMK
jgi:Flp pilus assembly protein TadD